MTAADRQRDTRSISITEYAILARTESIDLSVEFDPESRSLHPVELVIYGGRRVYNRISRAVVLTGVSR
jgi:hypothetical protein